jgi:hypothetical protein
VVRRSWRLPGSMAGATAPATMAVEPHDRTDSVVPHPRPDAPSPSGVDRLPPLAPRIVLRPSAPAVATADAEAVPGTATVRRAWKAARPGPAGSALPGAVMSGHRAEAADSGEEGSARRTNPVSPPAGVDVDRLIEAIEEHVLAEIERRGGRYTGVF